MLRRWSTWMGAWTAFSVLAACSGAPTRLAAPEPTATEQPISRASPATIPPKDMPTPAALTSDVGGPLLLQSDAFPDGSDVPVRYTCEGENASPPLTWRGVPSQARALLLVVFDADAGRDLGATTDLGFIHWLVVDLPVTLTGLEEGATGSPKALSGGVEASNDFSSSAGSRFASGATIRGTGYDGPCPPARHTYVFRLLALDGPLGLAPGTRASEVLKAVEGHVLAAAAWTGSFGPTKWPGPGWAARCE